MTRDELNGVKTLLPFLAIKHIYLQPFVDVINALEAAWKERDDTHADRQALACQVEAAKREIKFLTARVENEVEFIAALRHRNDEREGRVAERDKDILRGVKDGWRDVAQERLSQCSRLNLLLNKSECERCDLKLALHKVECERDELRETVKVLSERLADMAVERDGLKRRANETYSGSDRKPHPFPY